MQVRKWDGLPISKPGWVSGIPIERYHSAGICNGPAVSSSNLRRCWTHSPAHMFAQWCENPNAEPKEATRQMVLGQAAHHLLLGEDGFSTKFVAQPPEYPDKKTGEKKKWHNGSEFCKAWNAKQIGKTIVTVEELQRRLREGKVYRAEKVEQALTHFFRKSNLSTLRELALRAVADEVGEKAASDRAREGLEPAPIPERVMVCLSSNALAPRVIRAGARIAGRFGSKWFAVYVETPHEQPGRISPADADALQRNIRLAESLGATVVRVKAERLSDGLIAFARYEGITHVIMGQSARSRWELMWRGSPLDKLLSAVPDAAVQVVPLTAQQTSSGQ